MQFTRPPLACAPLGAPFGPSLQPVSRPSSLLCPLLTSMQRSACLAADPALICTKAPHRSPQISPTPFIARSPSLRFRALIGMDFAATGPLVRPLRLIGGSCSSTCDFASALPPDAASRQRPCTSLTFAPIGLVMRLSLIEVWDMLGVPEQPSPIRRGVRRRSTGSRLCRPVHILHTFFVFAERHCGPIINAIPPRTTWLRATLPAVITMRER